MATGSPPGSDPGNEQQQFRMVGQALSLGAELVTPALVGWWLDQQYGWAPVGVVSGGVLGFVLVIIHALRLTPTDKPPREPPSEKRTP